MTAMCNECKWAAAVRALMLCATTHVDVRATKDAGKDTTDESTRVSRCSNVTVVQHCMSISANRARPTWLGFGEYNTQSCITVVAIDSKSTHRRMHGCRIDGIDHHTMVNRERSRPSFAHAHDDNFMTEEFNALYVCMYASIPFERGKGEK